ncbi:uncharacterized protein KY384_004329 [Bacidia gigantensis]|uniref:uncharacterized protein n=1 Tax=Bacidia gigantensis TaxID=2732470 RepID=UPI001D049B44|nr:uncharacterized protein KY384_004329 [Bacidia gigantensis]KAG8530972.1 hypothetical protein KY384_004329 [Bacidia gigantensis]
MLANSSTSSAVVAVGVIQLLLIIVFYRLYWHPLSSFPGPKSWAISRIPYSNLLQKGTLAHKIKELHEIYGQVVRIAPNELSFTSPKAWRDIYGHHQGRPNFPKNRLWMATGPDGIDSILSANDADHSRYRRLLSHAFSERALKSQEHLLLRYVDLLVTRLKVQLRDSGRDVVTADLTKWFEYTVVDIVGDLAFGESFHCLETSRLHTWVSTIFTHFKFLAIVKSIQFFPGVEIVVRSFLARSLAKKREEQMSIANGKIQRRIDDGIDSQRNDFMTYVQRYNDDRSMSVPEIKSTFRVLVVAGSETTATTLAAIMNFLLQFPDVNKILVKEIRESFKYSTDITSDRVNGLSYLTAVVEEGLRMGATVPLGMPRVVPEGGAYVDGYWLPAGTFVSAPQFASNYSRHNWQKPDTFIPERFLGEELRYSKNESPNKEDPGKDALNAFSLGPRNCIGRNLAYLEMRLILAKLLWEFDFSWNGEPWGWSEQKTWILWDKRALMVNVRLRGS